MRGGYPPTMIVAVVDDGEVVALRAHDVSGGGSHAYSWRCSDEEISFLASRVLEELPDD